MRRLSFTICALGLLAACGDPLQGIPRLSNVPASNPSATVAPAASETRSEGGGLFGRLLNRPNDDPTNAAVEAALADVGAMQAPPGAGGDVDDDAADASAGDDTSGGGLFGLFRRGASSDAPAVPRTGPDATDVTAGQIVPFGQMARVCGLQRNQLGSLMSDAAGFRIYDTNPSSTESRAFFITGFDDNCARTFAGAVVVPGNIQTHEFVRYQGSNEGIGYTTTDNAYEALKASVCRVGRGQPCGGRTAQMNRNTLFVTVYSFFGGTFSAVPTEWAQILLHDGRALAMSVKDG